MASIVSHTPLAKARKELIQRGGDSAARCYQCATCSSVCELSAKELPFPRQQMLWAQWGMVEHLAADPSIWLCHQCNDCSERCPRDAKPGDVMQVLRAMVVEHLAAPAWLGRLVGNAAMTWPILLGAPILFWVLVLWAATGLAVPPEPVVYGDVVPHWLIYAVYFPVTGFVSVVAMVSGLRVWNAWGQNVNRQGSFVSHLIGVAWEISTHSRFDSCGPAKTRRWGHLALLWGFVGAAVTSGLLIVWMYGFNVPMPLPQHHPVKILGNISAVFLVVGVFWLLVNRLADGTSTGRSTAFDTFFLWVVVILIVTGCLVEAARYVFSPELAMGLYIVHLGTVLTLFITFPYSKFAHVLYRTLAMIHERMVAPSQRR